MKRNEKLIKDKEGDWCAYFIKKNRWRYSNKNG
jgi:hypothetical protein